MTIDKSESPRPDESVPLWAKIALVGGGAVALASGVYLDKHEVRTSDQALFTIAEFEFMGNDTLTHVDEPEVVAGIAGIGGLVTSSLGAMEILEHRRRNR